MSGELLLRVEGICKSFGPTRALINVDLEVRRGEIVGLIGENGSGKSTLASIFVGTQKPDSGKMYMHNKLYQPNSMLDGQKAGINIIVQEMGTLPRVSVASNVFVGNMERLRKHGLLDKKQMNEETNRILKEINAGNIQADESIDSLNFEDRKIVEIARAMYHNPEILIIDETTTALAQKGRHIIYELIKKMKRQNKAVIFISHDLDELLEVCNTITVLRDGVKIDTLTDDRMNIATMRKLMVGRELTDNYYRSDYDGSYSEKAVLKANRISSGDGMIVNMDLELHEGEILGIGGLANSGMHELGKILFGASKPITGEVVHINTEDIIKNPGVSIKNRTGYVSKDRDIESLIVNLSILNNIGLTSFSKTVKAGIISNKEEKKIAQKQIKMLKIKCVTEKQTCNELSGGNKQKVVLGKWLANDCNIIIMDCPTRGIDVGVKAAIYSIMYDLKKAGKSIVMISEELPELIGMSDRIIIMKDGKIVAQLDRSKQVTESTVIDFMI